jgi:GTP-binding protein HflX
MAAVRATLDEIGAGDVPQLIVFNKIDVTTEGKRLVEQHPGSIAISAVTGDGIDHLLDVLGDRLRSMSTVVELLIPYDRGDVLAALHRDGEVLVESHEEGGTRVRARLDDAPRNRYAEFVIVTGTSAAS